MSYIKELEIKVKEIIKKAGYELEEFELCISNRPDLGEFQINDAMKLAKTYHKSPIQIANDIGNLLKEDKSFKDINIAGAGFINLSLSDDTLIEFIEDINENIKKNIEKVNPRKIMIDYGGANAAKMLHVGHLRSPNIGEALKRLAKLLGCIVIADVHLGDSGAQSGMVVYEMMQRFPNLSCFQAGYSGEEFELPIVKEDLNIIYPEGAKKAKENEEIMEKCREITLQIQKGFIGYTKLWNKIVDLSSISIKEIYDKLNAEFDLWEGEQDSYKYINEFLEIVSKEGLSYLSEGATVIDVSEENDEKEMPPVLLVKSDGAYLYATTDLATILGRMKRFNPDEIWYFTDNRQELHFEQVFRAAKKAKIVDDKTKLGFFGFGTMNGLDGKPFKTRSGGTMTLQELIETIKIEIKKRLNTEIVEKEKIDETVEKLSIATLKYADLCPHRSTDYIFDIAKFSDFEGKTGPYILYSTIRIKSLLSKADNQDIKYNKMSKLQNNSDREVIITLLNLPNVLQKSFEAKSLNEITEYLFKLTSIYNKFYNENKILTNEDKDLKESWLVLSKTVYKTNLILLDTLGIKCPEKM